MGYRVRIKICGLSCVEDAALAADLGADFLGFVFASSPRRLAVEEARTFWERLPSGVPRVGVFKDQTEGEVRNVLDTLSLDYLQFHGGESPEFAASFGLPVIRACGAEKEEDLQELQAWNSAEIFLVDLPKRDTKGVLPLDVARAAAALSKPTLLAGGLAPENVGEIIAAAHPWGVDVARGVELEPGRKDFEKLRRFFEQARKL